MVEHTDLKVGQADLGQFRIEDLHRLFQGTVHGVDGAFTLGGCDFLDTIDEDFDVGEGAVGTDLGLLDRDAQFFQGEKGWYRPSSLQTRSS